jgi:hypothetical protein
MTAAQAKSRSSRMPIWKALLLFLPMLLISAVMWLGDVLSKGDPLITIAAVPTYLAFRALFFLMLITGKTHRYRSVMFMSAAIALLGLHPLDDRNLREHAVDR